jgi:hypothetical protein
MERASEVGHDKAVIRLHFQPAPGHHFTVRHGLMAQRRSIGLLAALLSLCLLCCQIPPASAQSPALPPTSEAIAAYKRALAEYLQAHDAFLTIDRGYWQSVKQERASRISKRAHGERVALDDYVLTQPPKYTGPPRPVNPEAPQEKPPRAYIPVVADFLAAAKAQFNVVPQRPASELEFKHAYARVASAAGLTRDQAVRVYGFEASGNGLYDVQAGLEYNPNGHAISTALGYNQLLTTNSVELMAEAGGPFIKALQTKAAQLPDAAKPLIENKIAVAERMVAFAKTVPDDWGQHEALAGTQKGWAVHAMNLDIDIGPLLQTQKLMMSVLFARAKGYNTPLTAAELEMMNLTGDGTGFDMVTMPQDWRDKVPTSNFFQESGYRENPVAQRNNTVAKLIAATNAEMDVQVQKQGARDLAAAFSR